MVADHTVVKANVEEGLEGETVALVMKDIQIQFRHVRKQHLHMGRLLQSAALVAQ